MMYSYIFQHGNSHPIDEDHSALVYYLLVYWHDCESYVQYTLHSHFTL